MDMSLSGGLPVVSGGKREKIFLHLHEIVRLYASGLKVKQVAERLGISKETVRNALESDAGRQKIDEIDRFRDGYALRVQKKICDLTEKSLQKFEYVLDGVDENGNEVRVSRDQLHVAGEVLEKYSGFKAATKIQAQHNHNITENDLEDSRKRWNEERKRRGYGDIIDVEPEKEGNESHDGILD